MNWGRVLLFKVGRPKCWATEVPKDQPHWRKGLCNDESKKEFEQSF
jgi:hypothetical protein